MFRPVFVRLSARTIAKADRYGLARHWMALGHRLRDVNNLIVDELAALALHILGCRTELAGQGFLPSARWLPLEDIRGGDEKKLPDLVLPSGLSIDVKGSELDRHRLIAPVNSLVEKYAYLFITAEQHPRYMIHGWLWGDELLRCPVRELLPRRPCYVADRPLRDPRELLAAGVA